MNPTDIAQQIAEAQLQKLLLENAKLQTELSRPAQGSAWLQLLVQFVPLITALVSVCALLWGVYQYTSQQEKDRVQRAEQAKKDVETGEREFMKPWLESQRTTYLDSLKAAEIIANSVDAQERTTALQAFWRLYHGRMVLVETTNVSGAMVAIGDCLKKNPICSSDQLNTLTRALSTAIKDSMAATAKMSYQEFSSNQFRYMPPP